MLYKIATGFNQTQTFAVPKSMVFNFSHVKRIKTAIKWLMMCCLFAVTLLSLCCPCCHFAVPKMAQAPNTYINPAKIIDGKLSAKIIDGYF